MSRKRKQKRKKPTTLETQSTESVYTPEKYGRRHAPGTLRNLPCDTLKEILSYLTFKDWMSARQVCRWFRDYPMYMGHTPSFFFSVKDESFEYLQQHRHAIQCCRYRFHLITNWCYSHIPTCEVNWLVQLVSSHISTVTVLFDSPVNFPSCTLPELQTFILAYKKSAFRPFESVPGIRWHKMPKLENLCITRMTNSLLFRRRLMTDFTVKTLYIGETVKSYDSSAETDYNLLFQNVRMTHLNKLQLHKDFEFTLRLASFPALQTLEVHTKYFMMLLSAIPRTEISHLDFCLCLDCKKALNPNPFMADYHFWRRIGAAWTLTKCTMNTSGLRNKPMQKLLDHFPQLHTLKVQCPHGHLSFYHRDQLHNFFVV